MGSTSSSQIRYTKEIKVLNLVAVLIQELGLICEVQLEIKRALRCRAVHFVNSLGSNFLGMSFGEMIVLRS